MLYNYGCNKYCYQTTYSEVETLGKKSESVMRGRVWSLQRRRSETECVVREIPKQFLLL